MTVACESVTNTESSAVSPLFMTVACDIVTNTESSAVQSAVHDCGL
jgi:hypothetical protein